MSFLCLRLRGPVTDVDTQGERKARVALRRLQRVVSRRFEAAMHELSSRIPIDRSIRKGVWPDLEHMTATTGLWQEGDSNCCATGGQAKFQLSLKDHRLTIELPCNSQGPLGAFVQLTLPFKLIALTLGLLMSHVGWSQQVPGPDTDWSRVSYESFGNALEDFYQEREPKNLPAMRSAIVELRRRVARRGVDTPEAMVTLHHFLMAQATHEFIDKSINGQIPASVQELPITATDPAKIEAIGILREAWARFPHNAAVLKSVLSSELRFSAETRSELHLRLLRVEPKATVKQMFIMNLVDQGRTAEARREAVRLFQGMGVDEPDIDRVYAYLPENFLHISAECDRLAEQLGTLRSEIPIEFQRGDFWRSRMANRFRDEAHRKAKSAVMQQILIRTQETLAISRCGTEPAADE